MSDEVGERIRPLIPAAPSHAKGGRRSMHARKALEAIVEVLRTGIQWNALPHELGASATLPARFQEWERAGLFKVVWQAGLSQDDCFRFTKVVSEPANDFMRISTDASGQ